VTVFHSTSNTRPTLGSWTPDPTQPPHDDHAQIDAIRHVRQPVFLVEKNNSLTAVTGGKPALSQPASTPNALPVVGIVPPCPLENLGDPSFRSDHHVRFAYMTGSMANGIASADIVEAISNAGMLASFGSAGLPLQTIEATIDRLSQNLANKPYCFNLIHTPNEPSIEASVVDLYLRRGIRLIEASAFLDLTLPILKYRLHGIHRDPNGHAVAPNQIIAKLSRIEVATKFFSPPPDNMLQALVAAGYITPEQAQLATQIPVAQDVTAEADSGGHTDNQPAIAMFPTMLALRDKLQAKYNYPCRLRLGAGGGISTPQSAAAAFAMGVSYIVTGSVNQACTESGSSDNVRKMLAQAQQADVTMAPAADMFEMGVRVQVLKRGTMFPMRAAKLYEIYRTYPGIDQIPPAERTNLEKNVFKTPLDEIWQQTHQFFQTRDPDQVQRAQRDPKHKMALIFRWYLGLSSRWANKGEPSRQIDYQIWCGPAMGAFNEWTAGTFLAEPQNRKVVTVALNILYGAALLTRCNSIRSQGIQPPSELTHIAPLPLEQLQQYTNP
jgi:PfaD family protein